MLFRSVEAKIIVDQSDPSSLKIPTAALEVEQHGVFVYRLETSSTGYQYAQRTPIQIGRSNRKETEVVSGLELGDQLVIYPPEALRDGSWVQTTSR